METGGRYIQLVAAMLVATALLQACATTEPGRPEPIEDLFISGLVIENRSQSYITAARLLVPESGNFVSCGNIAPRAVCSTGFPERSYTGNAVEMTWSQLGSIHSTGEIYVVPSEAVIEAGHAILKIVVLAPGSAGLELVESAPPDSSP